MKHSKKHIIYFDGICNLCHYFVRFVKKHDRHRVFDFDTLQSQNESDELSTVKLFKNGQWLEKSDAFFEIITEFGGIWIIVSKLKWIPRSIRDVVYVWIAKNRYKWFGKQSECKIDY